MSAEARTINFRRQIVFWASIFALTFVVMWLLGDVLLPFVAGMAIAYLCNPLTNRLERLLPRWIAALIVITLVVLFCRAADPADRAGDRRAACGLHRGPAGLSRASCRR